MHAVDTVDMEHRVQEGKKKRKRKPKHGNSIDAAGVNGFGYVDRLVKAITVWSAQTFVATASNSSKHEEAKIGTPKNCNGESKKEISARGESSSDNDSSDSDSSDSDEEESLEKKQMEDVDRCRIHVKSMLMSKIGSCEIFPNVCVQREINSIVNIHAID